MEQSTCPFPTLKAGMCSWECHDASPINTGPFRAAGGAEFGVEVRHPDCRRSEFELAYLAAQATILYVDCMLFTSMYLVA